MRRRKWYVLAATLVVGTTLVVAGFAATAGSSQGLTKVTLQSKWVVQSQFAGYYAAVANGYYEDEGLDVTILEGAVEIVPQQVVASGGAEFGIAWVPKVLASREADADLVNIAQVFQRSGTLEVSFVDTGIESVEDFRGRKIGTWGYDILARRFFPPTTTADVMGYCQPIWVSDYTYRRLFERVQAVDGLNVVIPPEMLDLTWERVQIDAQGNATFLDPVKLHRPPMADPTPVELESPSGTEVVEGQLYRYDHLDGGVILWPRSSAAFSAAKIQLAGQLITAIK